MEIKNSVVVVCESSSDELTDYINKLIEDGYRPQGGVSMSVDKDSLWFSQLMVYDTEVSRTWS